MCDQFEDDWHDDDACFGELFAVDAHEVGVALAGEFEYASDVFHGEGISMGGDGFR